MISVHKAKPGQPLGDTTLHLRPDSERTYTDDEVCCLLEMASDLGFSLEEDSPLDNLTVGELDRLVHTIY